MAGKRFSRRTAAVVAAVVLAAVATVAFTSYVKAAEAHAVASQQPVNAFVAKDTIPSGTSAQKAEDDGLITRTAIPRHLLADGAITSLSQISGKVSAVSIMKGEQILSARFVAPQDNRGLLTIPSDLQAVSVQVGIPAGVASFVEAGDHVSVIAKVEDGGAGGSQTSHVQYLIQDVEVLAVGQRVVTKTSQTGNQSTTQTDGEILMTLAVSPADAEKIVYGTLAGQIYFTLVPPGQAPVTTPGRTASNLFS